MLRDITLGQYYQTDSVIHRLDPRVKLTGTILYIISLFLFHQFTGYLVAALFLGVAIRLSKVPFCYMVRGMKAILFLLLFTMAFNLFLTPGEPLVQFWKLTITRAMQLRYVSSLYMQTINGICRDIFPRRKQQRKQCPAVTAGREKRSNCRQRQ